MKTTLALACALLVVVAAVSCAAQDAEPAVQMAAGTLWAVQQLGSKKVQYCWRQSYGRGVGHALGCTSEQQESGALCYPPCEQGYNGVGPVCWQDCPSGFTDTGVDCLKPPAYGRGAGYALWDHNECNSQNPQGCEQYGLMWYPVCNEGFHNVGCCICSPDCPDNMVDIGVSCQRASYGRGAGEVITTCPADEEESGLLCYPPCQDGYHGVGPVCWGNCGPMQPYSCAAGCATDAESCGMSVFDMIKSVFEFALDIVELAFTGGAADVAQAALKDVIKSAINGAIAAAEFEIESAAHQAAAEKIKDAVQQAAQQMTTTYSSVLIPALAQQFGEAQAALMFHDAVMHVAVSAVSSPEYNIVDFVEDFAPFGIGALVKAFDKPLCDASVPPQRCSEVPSVCGSHGSCSSTWTCQCDAGWSGPLCNETDTSSLASSPDDGSAISTNTNTADASAGGTSSNDGSAEEDDDVYTDGGESSGDATPAFNSVDDEEAKNTSNHHKDKLSPGASVGIALGVIAAAALIAFGITAAARRTAVASSSNSNDALSEHLILEDRTSTTDA